MPSSKIEAITCVHTHKLPHFNIFSSPLLSSLFFSLFSPLLSSFLLSSLLCFALIGVEFRFGCAVDDVVVSDEEDQKDKRITGTYVD